MSDVPEGTPVERLLPDRPTLSGLRGAAARCRACDLWRGGTQTVFGEGSERAELMLVGEQPGDREDVEGHPFVGPAGAVLDRALVDAGIDRSLVYVTNAVKHFKWVRRGKRRLHEKPDGAEMAACRPWLEAEIGVVGPRLVVCLGATAGQTLLGPSFRVLRERGQFLSSPLGTTLMPTVHPSSILRASDPEARERAYADFVADLRGASRWLRETSP